VVLVLADLPTQALKLKRYEVPTLNSIFTLSNLETHRANLAKRNLLAKLLLVIVGTMSWCPLISLLDECNSGVDLYTG